MINALLTCRVLFVAMCLVLYPRVLIAANLELPVHGKWIVIQAPPCVPGNWGNHCNTRSNQFALDVVPFGVLCIGAPIYAPSSGQIIEVIDGIPNGVHGGHDAGNHVVIKRSNSEFITLAHFSPGPIQVHMGQTVEPGQQIGLCGVSGNAPGGPHLHFHMQATPNILDYLGAPGLPMFFSNVQVFNPMIGGCESRSNYAPGPRDAFC